MNQRNSQLLRLLDYFSLPLYSTSSLTVARARAMVGTNLVTAMLFLAGAIFTLALNSMGQYSLPFALGLLLPIAVINIILPFLMRHINCLMFNQQLTLLFALTGIGSGVFFNGGPLIATNTELTLLAPALAFFLLGTRGGLFWSLMALSMQATMYGLHLYGYIFPNYQDPATINTVAIFNWTVAFLAIIFLIMMIEVSREQLEQQRSIERGRFKYMATHDALTRIANRALFEERLKAAIKKNRNINTQVVLLYLDLDNFKPINDQWGHSCGDTVLQVFASRLLESTRDSDTVARLGGDEFAVLFTEIEKETNINILVNSLYNRVTQGIHINSETVEIQCSIGICQYPANANSAEQLWNNADSAMYTAKKDYSKHWHIYRSDQIA